MSVIVLSCADSNVRQINYSNVTVKNDEIEFLEIEKKKTSEDKTTTLINIILRVNFWFSFIIKYYKLIMVKV